MQALMGRGGGGVSIVFVLFLFGVFLYLRIYPYNFRNFFFLALCQVDYSIPWLRSNFTELWPHAQSYIPKFLIYSFSLGIQRGHPPTQGKVNESWSFPVIICQKPTKILQLSGSVESFWEACSFEALLFLQPFLSQHCTGSRYSDKLKESCLDEEAWPDKSPGKFTELLTFPHSKSPGSNWLLLIRFPCCNWQLLIRCCHLLQ